MRTAVIGTGHVGLVTAGGLARWGHTVIGMDDDASKIAKLEAGGLPFFEPGLNDLVNEGVEAGRLTFTTDLEVALKDCDVAFVCVGTPGLPGGGPNLAYVERVGVEAARLATGDLVLVEKSTVPANTGVRLAQVIAREQARHGKTHNIQVASNPEFLKEGTAVQDTLFPDRVVIGSAVPEAGETLRAVYEPMLKEHGCPVVMADLQTAELIKHASNAFLATKISFINQVALICDEVGADVTTVAQGMGLDERIGQQFLRAGIGYGGSCFPKDVNAFIHLAQSIGEDFHILEAVRDVNVRMREVVIERLRQELWHLEGKTVTLLGAAFKPGTDDLREAPAMHLAKTLMAAGVKVRIFDPVAIDHVKNQLPDVECFTDVHASLRDADAAVVCTEWDEVKALTPADFAEGLGYPIVVDGRNVFDPEAMRAAGLRYTSIGRPKPKD